MCFNPLITWTTAGLGIVTGIFLKSKHQPRSLYLPPIYFSCMEILQGLMYAQLHHKTAIIVQILVYLAYVHVCFQPLVLNYWLGTFLNSKQKSLYIFTIKLCLVGGVLLLSRIFLLPNTPMCSTYETLCSPNGPHIFYGIRHIAWELSLKGAGWNYITPSIGLHMFLFFIPGIFLGFCRLMLLFFLAGPFLAAYLTPNASEQSSIWCVIGLWWLVITILFYYNKAPKWLQLVR